MPDTNPTAPASKAYKVREISHNKLEAVLNEEYANGYDYVDLHYSERTSTGAVTLTEKVYRVIFKRRDEAREGGGSAHHHQDVHVPAAGR